MTKETAERTHCLLLESAAAINQSIVVVRDGADDQEFRAYRMAAGYLLAKLMDDLMMPLYREFPDLVPPELDSDALRSQL